MFQNSDYEAYWQELQNKREGVRVGNSIGGMMLISSFLVFVLNLGVALAFLLFGKTNILADAGTTQILQILFSSIVLVLPPLLLPIFTGDRLKEIFPSKRPPLKTAVPLVMMGCGVCALANLGNGVFASFFSSFGVTPVAQELDLPSGFFGTLLIFLSGAFFPALVEEFAIRGVLFGVVKKHFGNGAAIWISSIVFSLMHGNLVQIPFAFLLGLYLGYMTAYTGSLYPAVFLHFFNNFMSYALDMLTQNLGPTAINIITLLYFVLLLCIGIAGLLLFTQSHTTMQFECQETKKHTLRICKAPCMIFYYVLIGIEILLVQFGLY
ncbi:MAG: CPBP family intramembrane metalloprotease [Clostridia bacterium]|nr:CPBP family intramembrane metalloprotease [Clostridia bacterium]